MQVNTYRLLLTISIILILCLTLLSLTSPIVPTQKKLLSINKTKYILYYYPMFGHSDFWLGTGKKVFQKCAYTNCYITFENNEREIDDWDAILFHIPEKQIWDKPTKRKAFQRYIFYSMESPVQTYNPVQKYNGFINWTMTYRLDSDIYRPYARLQPAKTQYEMPKIEDIVKRPKKIAWFVSHCNAKSRRDDLYKAINKSIPVDVYGKCGTHKCDKHDNCEKMVEDNYKFYLAFENSICTDYITEKTFSILKYNIIPIVYSGANITNILPVKSVINVQDFKTVQELIDYIKFLDNNPEEYLKYFEWKKSFRLEYGGKIGLCNLCEALHVNKEVKIYNDLVTWWIGNTKKHCTTEFISRFLGT